MQDYKRDPDLRFKILDFIKQECIKQGGSVQLTYCDIAIGIGDATSKEDFSTGQKIMKHVDALARSGRIKVEKGEGRTPNTYTFVDDTKEIIASSNKDKENLINKFSENTDKIYESIKETFSMAGAIIKKNEELAAENARLKSALLTMSLIGENKKDNTKLFETPMDSPIAFIVEQLRNEQKNKAEDLMH
jgi:regulator of replication initiation timing